MSTDFRLNDKVSAHDLFGERLKKFGVQEYVTPKTGERSRCLTDGRNYLWVYLTEDGFVGCLSRYGANGHLYFAAYKKEVIPECEVADSIAPNWCFDIILQSRDDERAVSCL